MAGAWIRDTWGENSTNLDPNSAESSAVCLNRYHLGKARYVPTVQLVDNVTFGNVTCDNCSNATLVNKTWFFNGDVATWCGDISPSEIHLHHNAYSPPPSPPP